MLSGVDALVFDIQDAGARFYTYRCTMLYALEQAAKSKLAVLCSGPAQSHHRRPYRGSAAGRESG